MLSNYALSITTTQSYNTPYNATHPANPKNAYQTTALRPQEPLLIIITPRRHRRTGNLNLDIHIRRAIAQRAPLALTLALEAVAQLLAAARIARRG